METAALALMVVLSARLARTGPAITRAGEETPTTCEDLTVVEGEEASIRCHFGRDVSSSKTNIDVQFYPSLGHKPVSVLRCNWLVIKPDEPTCSVKSGCDFNKRFGDTVEVKINKTTKDYEGTYMCRLVPSRGVPAHSCSLTIKDGLSTEGDKEKPTTETDLSNPDINLTENTRVYRNVPAIVLGTVVIFLNMCIVVLTLVARHWRRERDELRSNDGKKSEPSAMNYDSPLMPEDKTSAIIA